MAKTPAAAAMDAIIKGVSPILVRNGFRKDGKTFRRVSPDGIIQLVNFQMSQFGSSAEGKFAVNLGICVPEFIAHFFPHHQGKKINIVDCTLFERLACLKPDKRDDWWTTSEHDRSVAEVNELLERYGLRYLASYSSRTQLLEVLRANDYVVPRFRRSRVTAAVILAKQGDIASAAAVLNAGIQAAKREGEVKEESRLRHEGHELGLSSLLLP
jgi:Domain of unknown function (DUF4304)